MKIQGIQKERYRKEILASGMENNLNSIYLVTENLINALLTVHGPYEAHMVAEHEIRTECDYYLKLYFT